MRSQTQPLSPRCGILIGSAFGGMNTFATAVEALETQSAPPAGGRWEGRPCRWQGALLLSLLAGALPHVHPLRYHAPTPTPPPDPQASAR